MCINFALKPLQKIAIITTILCYLFSLINKNQAQLSASKNNNNNIILKLELNSDQRQQQQINNGDNNLYKYAVVVDCGSSGSRAHIYRWLRSVSSDELPIRIEPARNNSSSKEDLILRIRPGISSFRYNPDMVSDYMHPIMDFVSSNVPANLHWETPIYFMGTAGLRLLNLDEQRKILDDLSNDLTREYDFPKLYGEVISGAREGQYQWLSVNSDQNRLTNMYNMSSSLSPSSKKNNFFCRSPRLRRFGVVELGGASAQVAYEISPIVERLVESKLYHDNKALKAFQESLIELNIGKNKRAKLFSTTFLGFGTNSARELSIDLLVRETMQISLPIVESSATPSKVTRNYNTMFNVENKTITLKDFCLPKGSEQTVIKSLDLIRDPTKTLGFERKSEQDSLLTVHLIGDGNYIKCRSLLNRMIMLIKQEETNCFDNDSSNGDAATNSQQTSQTTKRTCSTALINTNFIPFKYFQFIGLSEFYYTTKEILNADALLNQNVITKKINYVCSRPYGELLIKFPEANRIDKQRVLLECFKATWLLTILQVGFKMNPNIIYDFNTIRNFNDWTLGALIEKLHQ